MNLFDEEVLSAVIPRIRAWETLNNPEISSRLTTLEYYELLLEAGYTVGVAEELANDRAEARLNAGVMM